MEFLIQDKTFYLVNVSLSRSGPAEKMHEEICSVPFWVNDVTIFGLLFRLERALRRYLFESTQKSRFLKLDTNYAFSFIFM